MIHTVKGSGIVNKAEEDFFLEFSCFFHDPADVGNLISDSSAFPKTSLNIWKFMVYILLKPGLESFKPAFSLSSFTFIKRLFGSSLLSAIRVLSFAYMKLLIFIPAILILACASSSLAFHMVYSAYKLNKMVTIYSLGVLLSLFGTSLSFHVKF